LLHAWLVLGVGYSAVAGTSPDAYVVQKISAVPQVTVRTMVQTRDGYLWLGTYKGLNRFDGVRLVSFTVANTPSLSSDTIYVLHEDRSGNLWIGTDDGGIIRYRDGVFVSFGPEEGLTEREVRSISETRDGTLWAGTQRGLFRMANGRFTAWRATNIPGGASITGLTPIPDGGLWVASSRGLFRLMPGGASAIAVLSNQNVRCVAPDPYGMIWAPVLERANVHIPLESVEAGPELLPLRYSWFHGVPGGDSLLAMNGGTLFRLGRESTNFSTVAHFDKRTVFSACEDIEGNIWVGVEAHGLYRVRQKRVATHSTADGFPTDKLSTLAEDKAGRVWLGTFGSGLFVSENGLMDFQAARVPTVANITGFLERRDGSLWFGTYNGDCYRRANRVDAKFVFGIRPSSGCRVLYEDREGALWIGTVRGGVERHHDGQVTRFTTRDGLASDLARCFIQDAAGDYWIGTARGLNRLSGDKVVRFGGDEVLAKQSISTLHADRQGALWIGTAGGGLARYQSNRVQLITTRNGLASDWIEQILEDDEGNLWLGSQTGILRVSRAELNACADGRANFVNCLTLGPEDGMLAPNCGSGFKPSCMKSRSGELWFCTAGGLAIVDPRKVRPRSQPPPVHIEGAVADDQPLALQATQDGEARAVIIPPGVTHVAFRYTALSFSAPDKVRFRYRLEGYEESWVSAGTTREAKYTRLSAGEYRFHVTAVNNDGVSNETGAMLAVIVIPPWWQTAWFRVVAVLALAGFVFGLVELRVHQHRKARMMQEGFARRLIESQEQERKRVAGELHDSLGQSLQIIKGRAQLGLDRTGGNPESAKQFEEIASAAGQAIQEVRAISHALRPAELDQLGLTKAIAWMVEKAGATSSTKFACELEPIDGVLPPEVEISLYRIAQEGINNVLKHAQAKEAILELKRAANTVRLSIFDNGRGFAKGSDLAGLGDLAKGRVGQGLAGIAERVRLLGGELDLQSEPGRGTRLTVTCKLPQNNA
jgi:signal transduction histidine kinase/streptogramin lyase